MAVGLRSAGRTARSSWKRQAVLTTAIAATKTALWYTRIKTERGLVRLGLRVCRMMRYPSRGKPVPEWIRKMRADANRIRNNPGNFDPLHRQKSFMEVRRMFAFQRSTRDNKWLGTAPLPAIKHLCRTDDARLARMRGAYRQAQSAAEPTGMIVAFPHVTAMSVIPAYFAATGAPTSLVLEEIRPASNSQQDIEDARRQFNYITTSARRSGIELIFAGPNSGDALGKSKDALQRGRVVLIASDYYRSKAGGLQVSLGGQPRVVGLGAAKLALDTGAPVVAVSAFHRKAGWDVDISAPIFPRTGVPTKEGPLEARQLTRRIVAETESMLARHSAEWRYVGYYDNDQENVAVKRRQTINTRDAGQPNPYAPGTYVPREYDPGAAQRTPIPERPATPTYGHERTREVQVQGIA